MIRLSSAHIVIQKELAEKLFPNTIQVNWYYDVTEKTMGIASIENENFKKLHKTAMSMLKYKNSMNDRSISIIEMLIDHDIDQADKSLHYIIDEATKVLNVYI